MVAGDAKRVVVIKNISSDLIEEAILILKSGPGVERHAHIDTLTCDGSIARDHHILKEAEKIINQYILENGLVRKPGRNQLRGRRFSRINLSVNTLINILLMMAIGFLLLVVSRVF